MRKAVIILGALAGCSNVTGPVDDPENPAKLGTWRVVTSAESISIDDPSIKGDGHPVQQQQLDALGSRSTLTCGEPGIDAAEKLLKLYPQAIKLKDCSISDATMEGKSQSAVMACTQSSGKSQPPAKVTVTGTLDLAEAEASAESELYIRIVKPTGETGSATVSFKHRFERIGDCA